MPLTIPVIHQMLLDEVPATECFLQCYFIFKILVKIDMSHHIFCLYPPMTVGIGLLLTQKSFINHGTVRCQSFISCSGNKLN